MSEFKIDLQEMTTTIINPTQRGYSKPAIWAVAVFALVFLSASASLFFPRTEGSIKDIVSDPDKTVALTGLNNEEQHSLRELYYQREYQPLWLDADAAKVESLFLLKILNTSNKLGLDPNSYFVDQIQRRLYKKDTAKLAELDILLTVATAKFATHMHSGRFHYLSKTLNTISFDIFERNSDIHDLFSKFFQNEPTHEQYQALKKQLESLLELAANKGWPTAPLGLLKPGMNDSRVQFLKQRLVITGDLSSEDAKGTLYDNKLKVAVKRFQTRHGVLADGIAGKESIEILNVPVERRIKQVSINLDRWRSLTKELGEDYVLVNTASFELYGVKDGREKIRMRVVVGDEATETPIVSSQIREVVLNPDWRVPRSISTKEILPILKDKGHSKRTPYQYFRYVNNQRVEVNPAQINFKQYRQDYFPFDLVQKPGPRNPLGQIKFFMPNKHDVYLHDTPYKKAFKLDDRTRSHGCIRLERPFDLAAFILSADSQWNKRNLTDVIKNTGETVRIKLKEPLDVHLVYFTSWVDENGQLAFFDDVYDRDPSAVAQLNL